LGVNQVHPALHLPHQRTFKMNKYLVSITNLPEEQLFRAFYTKKNKAFFCFVYRKGEWLLNYKTHKPIKEQVYEINTFNKIQKHAKYFFTVYKASKFEYNNFMDSAVFYSSFSALRFFKLKFEELYLEGTQKKIIKKWRKFVSRYLSKKQLNEIVQELEKCQDIKILLSYWPIEISRPKPWTIHDETQFRYFENLKYYNFFFTEKLLTASFEEENPPLMQELYVEWEQLIASKKQEAFSVLEKEYTDAQKNNDTVTMEEIKLIRESIIDQTADLNLQQYKTPNSLFKYWPTLLYPGPDPVKV